MAASTRADDPGAALADELRGVIDALTSRELTSDRLARALEHARELRGCLSGERRPRWYEDDSKAHDPSPGSRAAYLAQSPIRGRLNPIAPPLETWLGTRGDGREAILGRARMGSPYEGPPHGVHGGFLAALFDDVLGAAQQLAAKAGVTAILKIRYRDITPLDEELRFEAWIHEEHGRRVVARATCTADGTLTADAEAIFIQVDFDEIRGRMRERRER